MNLQHKFGCHDVTLIYVSDTEVHQVLYLVHLALDMPVSLFLNYYFSKNLARGEREPGLHPLLMLAIYVPPLH